MQNANFLRHSKTNLYLPFLCLVAAVLLEGCNSLPRDADRGRDENCAKVKVRCQDASNPDEENKCKDGKPAIIELACTAVSKPCGMGCSRWQEGVAGCDIANPSKKCKTVYSGSSCVDCRCL